MLLHVETTIEVSHRILTPIADRDQIHGHSYWVRVYVLTEVKNPVPVETLKKDLQKIADGLDHTHLNDKIPDGTMESIAVWFAREFKTKDYQLKKVTILRKSMGIGVEYVLD